MEAVAWGPSLLQRPDGGQPQGGLTVCKPSNARVRRMVACYQNSQK